MISNLDRTRRIPQSARIGSGAFAFIALTLTGIASVSAQNSGGVVAQAPAIRDVTPPGFTRVYRDEKQEVPPQGDLLANLRVRPDASLQSNNQAFRLYGVTFPPRKKICTYPGGGRWACGQRAFLTLRNLLDGRSARCMVRGEGDEKAMSCVLENADVATSLLSAGWAELAQDVTDKSLVRASEFAQSQHVGLWAQKP